MFEETGSELSVATRVGVATDRRSREVFVELMFAAAIISVVVALATPSLRVFRDKVELLEAVTLSLGYRNDAIVRNALTGHFPERVPRPKPSMGPPGHSVASVAWRDDELVFGFDDRAATLGFRAAIAPVSGGIVWLCGYREPPPGFAAPQARHTSLAAGALLHFCRSGATN